MQLNPCAEIITSAVTANFLAQFYKFVGYFFLHKKLNFKRLFQTGGMPSSHSSFVMGMTVSVGLISGFSSADFAIAISVSLIVMYDAAGLRRAVGRQATVLNQILTEVFSEHPNLSGEKFRELLGHTPIEVIVGAALGTVIAILIHLW